MKLSSAGWGRGAAAGTGSTVAGSATMVAAAAGADSWSQGPDG
jgi:hypothetical protein